MGCAPNQVAKTLLLRDNAPTGPGASSKKRYAVFVLAQSDRLDLHAVRATLKTGEAQLASRNEIQQVLGTVPGAVSPFMTGSIPLYVDENLLGLRIIFVNGGVSGVDIEIAPVELVEVTRAQVGRYSLEIPGETGLAPYRLSRWTGARRSPAVSACWRSMQPAHRAGALGGSKFRAD